MPRIRLIGMEEASPFTREMMEHDVAQHGHVFPGTGIYGYAPTIQEGTKALNAGITAAERIPKQLRALTIVRVASIVGGPF